MRRERLSGWLGTGGRRQLHGHGRSKEHLESLQAQVDRLQAENAALRRRLSAADGGGAAEDPGAAKGMGGPGVGDNRAADAELGIEGYLA